MKLKELKKFKKLLLMHINVVSCAANGFLITLSAKQLFTPFGNDF